MEGDNKNTSKKIQETPKASSSFRKEYAKRNGYSMLDDGSDTEKQKKIINFHKKISKPLPYYKNKNDIEDIWAMQKKLMFDMDLAGKSYTNMKRDLVLKMRFLYEVPKEKIEACTSKNFGKNSKYTGFLVDRQKEGWGEEKVVHDSYFLNLDDFLMNTCITGCILCLAKLDKNPKEADKGYVEITSKGKWQMGLKHGSDFEEVVYIKKCKYCECSKESMIRGYEYLEAQNFHFYEGGYIMGLKEGFGTEFYYDQTKYPEKGPVCYVGCYKDGKRHGQGISYARNGEVIYEGNFIQGEKQQDYNTNQKNFVKMFEDGSSNHNLMEKIDDQANKFKQLGNKEHEKGNYQHAIDLFTLAIEVRKDKIFYGNRAASYFQTGQYQNCIDDCNNALNIDQSFVKCYLRKGRAQKAIGQIKDAIRSLIKARELETDQANNQAIKIELDDCQVAQNYEEDVNKLNDQGKFIDAMRKCEMILDRCPNYITIKLKFIEILNKKGDTEQSQKRCVELAGTMPDDSPDFDFLFAQAHYYSGAKTLAKEYWEKYPGDSKCSKALKNDKKSEDDYYKGNKAFNDNRYDDAIKNYQDSIAHDPWNRQFNSKAYGNISSCYVNKRDDIAALKSINQAIQQNDQYVKAYIKRALLYKKFEDWESVERDYKKAKSLDESIDIDHEISEVSRMINNSKTKDHFKILGVSREASSDDIKRSFRELSLKMHPDKAPEGQEDFYKKKYQEIVEAKEILLDPEQTDKLYGKNNQQQNYTGNSGQYTYQNQSQYNQKYHTNNGTKYNYPNYWNGGNAGQNYKAGYSANDGNRYANQNNGGKNPKQNYNARGYSSTSSAFYGTGTTQDNYGNCTCGDCDNPYDDPYYDDYDNADDNAFCDYDMADDNPYYDDDQYFNIGREYVKKGRAKSRKPKGMNAKSRKRKGMNAKKKH